MQTSLKANLLTAIKNTPQGYLTIEGVERIAHQSGNKVDNASRRLRELMQSGAVEAVRNKKGAIIGYKSVKVVTTGQIERQNEKLEQGQMFSTQRRYY